MKTKRLLLAVCLLLISATMLGTASFAWFSMNTEVAVDGIEVEAYSDALFLEISDTGDDDDYDTTLDLAAGKKTLRVVTPITVGNAYKLTTAAASGFYAGSTDTNTYYVKGDEQDDTYGALNYIKVDKSTLEEATDLTTLFTGTFTRTANTDTAVDGTIYCEKINNGYKKVTKTAGDSVYGLYVANLTAGTGVYAGESTVYYALESDTYVVEDALTQGSSLADFYTISSPVAVNLAAVNSDVHILDGEDYVCIYDYTGDGSSTVDLSKETFWGRTYSDALGEVQAENTLSTVKKAELQDTYYYYDTLYLRNAENTNDGLNLKIADVSVGGRVNELSPAIRVLFVATNGKGEVVTRTYSNRDGMSTFNGALFDKILGSKAEVVTVDMYIYFDGTDASVLTALDPAGALNGQSIEVKFSIAEHTYN